MIARNRNNFDWIETEKTDSKRYFWLDNIALRYFGFPYHNIYIVLHLLFISLTNNWLTSAMSTHTYLLSTYKLRYIHDMSPFYTHESVFHRLLDSGFAPSVLHLRLNQLYLDEYDHIFCLITFFEVNLKKLQTFKEKLQKKVTKMNQTCQGYNSWMEIFTKNGYCSQSCGPWLFVSFWICSLVFFQNIDVISTDIWAFLVEKLIKMQNHINSPLQGDALIWSLTSKRTLNAFYSITFTELALRYGSWNWQTEI